MELKKAHFYAWLSFWVTVGSLIFTLLFTMTLFYQAHRNDKGRGLYVLPQFLTSHSTSSRELISTSTFEKGNTYLDRDYDRTLIEEMLVRYYLEMRYTFFPDFNEMMYRWGWNSPLAHISTSRVHEEVVGDDLENKIRQMPDFVRTVGILDISRDKESSNAYQVQMAIYTLRQDGVFESTELYNVRLVFRYSNSRKFYASQLSNPYGLYFTYVDAQLVKG